MEISSVCFRLYRQRQAVAQRNTIIFIARSLISPLDPGLQACVHVDLHIEIDSAAKVIGDPAADIGIALHFRDGKGRGLVVRRQAWRFALKTVPFIMEISAVCFRLDRQRKAVTQLDLIAPIGRLLIGPLDPGPQTRIRENIKENRLVVPVVIINRAADLVGLFDLCEGEACGAFICRKPGRTTVANAVPSIAETALVHTGVHGKGHTASLLDRIFHILGFGPSHPGLQAAFRGDLEADNLRVVIVIDHVAIHGIVLIHIGNCEGRAAVIRRQQGSVQVRTLPFVMKPAQVYAGFHAEGDAFALFDGDCHKLILSPRRMGPQAGIRAEAKVHIFIISIVVKNNADDPGVPIHIVDGKGPGVLCQELGAVIQISVPVAVQLTRIHTGLHAQRGASSQRYGNTLKIRAGGCRAGPQPGIGRDVEVHRLDVSVVVDNRAGDSHKLVHVFNRKGIAVVLRKRHVISI